MQICDKNGLPQLTPRQALICAAVTGWKCDDPSSWPWPVAAADIMDWGRSYLPDMSDAEAENAFQELVDDGLFLSICYPIFQHEYYTCWYDSPFLCELPEGWTFPGPQDGQRLTVEDVAGIWSDLLAQWTDEYGPAFVWWGMCAGQGSQSGNSAWGPCLGPSCCWYTDGNRAECHHGLEFRRMPEVVLPDMRFLDDINWSKASDNEKERAMDAAILALRRVDPSLQCWTSAECNASCGRRQEKPRTQGCREPRDAACVA